MKICIIAVSALLVGSISSFAGTWTLMTDPTYVQDSSGVYYVPVSKTYANSPGVTFTLNTTVVNGHVADLHWDFVNGSPAESTAASPTVKYSTSTSYGASNPFTFTFDHFNSDGSGSLCSTTTKTNYVNVIKPYLQFNTSGFSSDDSLKTSTWVTGLGFANNPPSLGHGQSFTQSGDARGGYPYEYKVTSNPSHSGAVASDFCIVEDFSYTYTVYSGTTNVYHTPTAISLPETTYNPGDVDTVGVDQGVTPTNPVVYAFDSPGDDNTDAKSIMSTYSGDRVVYSLILNSTPGYQKSSNPLDTDLLETATFSLTARTDHAGNVNWSTN